MRIVLTGSPGVGKTSVAKLLGKRLASKVVNEKQFALEKGIGKWNTEEDELVIPLKEFGQELGKLLNKEKNIVIEGHMVCELKLPADFIVVLRCHPEILEERLRQRHYGEEKIQDNVFCEGIDYCKKRVMRRYPAKKVVEAQAGKTIKETLRNILMGLKEKGAKL